jgi:hypothetical protein
VDTGLLLVLAAVLLLAGSGKAGEASAAGASAPRKRDDTTADDVALMKRANLPAALAWRPDFEAHGISSEVAAALSRWAGIESSGNPLGQSKLGERGLLQCSKATALMKGGPYTQVEWDALIDPKTPRDEHVRLAIQLYEWLKKRALSHVADPPSGDVDGVWYAKLMHQWPADFVGKTSVGMHGPALAMAQELESRWASGAPHSLHRLHAADVVAFGLPQPWGSA